MSLWKIWNITKVRNAAGRLIIPGTIVKFLFPGFVKLGHRLFVSGLYCLISSIVVGSQPYAWSISSSALTPNSL